MHDSDNTWVKPRSQKARIKLLIYPQFQAALLIANALIMLLAFGVIGFAAHNSFNKLKQMGQAANLAEDHSYFRFLSFQAETVYTHLGIALAATLFISTFLTLFFSHRLAGPIVRMKRYFNHVAISGFVEKLNFRKGDFFDDLPDAVNQAMTKVASSSDEKKKAS